MTDNESVMTFLFYVVTAVSYCNDVVYLYDSVISQLCDRTAMLKTQRINAMTLLQNGMTEA